MMIASAIEMAVPGLVLFLGGWIAVVLGIVRLVKKKGPAILVAGVAAVVIGWGMMWAAAQASAAV